MTIRLTIHAASFMLMLCTTAMVFLWGPTDAVLGISQRIFYLHVPLAWVGFLAFGIIAMFGRFLPFPAKYLSVLAIALGFITFWPVLLDFVSRGVAWYIVPRVWFTAGDLTVGSGMIIDSLTIVMLAMITFVAMLIQIYSIGYMRHGHGEHAAER